jgi:hypothetical protein
MVQQYERDVTEELDVDNKSEFVDVVIYTETYLWDTYLLSLAQICSNLNQENLPMFR